MRRNKLLILFGSICLVLMFVAIPLMTACPAPEEETTTTTTTPPPTTTTTTPTPKEPVKIGVISSLTGWYAFNAIYSNTGMKTALKEINDGGGILGGRPIELVIRDDQSNLDVAMAAAEKLISEDKVKAIISGTDIAVAAGVLEVVRKYDIPYVEGDTPGDFLTWGSPYYAAVAVNPTIVEWVAVSATVVPQLNVTKLGILSIQTDFHSMGVQLAKDYMAGQPGWPEIVSEVFYPADAKDLSGPTTEVLSAKPDCLLVIEFREDILNSIWSFAYGKGYQGEKVVQAICLFPTQLEDIPEAIQGVYSVCVWHQSVDTPENNAFKNLYKEVAGEEPMFAKSATGYQGMLVLANAMDKAGTDSDTSKIAAAMHTPSVTDFLGGQLNFADDGRVILSEYITLQAQGDSIVYVEELGGEFPRFLD